MRVGHVWRVKPGRREDYLRMHATIWPELEALLRGAGVTSYTIYVWGDTVFSHMEVDDYDGLVERFAGDPVALRWEEQFADVLEYPNADPRSGWPERLVEVWDLDTRPPD
jgi:L-rhamnose mutarotase